MVLKNVILPSEQDWKKNIIVGKLRIKDSEVETVFCIGIQVFWIADEKDKKRHLPTTKISFYLYVLSCHLES